MAKRPAARVHTDLDAWKLADSLRSLVVKAVQKRGAAKDFKFRDQMRDAARSACRNTSEGFYRYRHGEFGHLLTVAYASLGEVLDCIDDGRNAGYFSQEEADAMWLLAKRAMGANMRLRQPGNEAKPPAPRTEHLAPSTQHLAPGT